MAYVLSDRQLLHLQTLQAHCACGSGCAWLTRITGTTGFAAIGPVNNTTLGRPTFARFATRTGQAARAALYIDLNVLGREIPRQLQAHLGARCTVATVTAVVSIGAATRAAPRATRRYAIGAIKADKTRRTGTAASVDK